MEPPQRQRWRTLRMHGATGHQGHQGRSSCDSHDARLQRASTRTSRLSQIGRRTLRQGLGCDEALTLSIIYIESRGSVEWLTRKAFLFTMFYFSQDFNQHSRVMRCLLFKFVARSTRNLCLSIPSRCPPQILNFCKPSQAM